MGPGPAEPSRATTSLCSAPSHRGMGGQADTAPLQRGHAEQGSTQAALQCWKEVCCECDHTAMLVAQLQMEGDARAVPLSQHVGTWVFNGVRSHTSPKSSMLISTGTADVSTQKEQGSAVPQALHTARANPCLGSRNPSAIGVLGAEAPPELSSTPVTILSSRMHFCLCSSRDTSPGAPGLGCKSESREQLRGAELHPRAPCTGSGARLFPQLQLWVCSQTTCTEVGKISRLVSHPHVPQYSRPQGHQLLREEQTPQGGTSQFGTHGVLVWGQAPWIASAPVLHPLHPHSKCPHQLPPLSRHPTHCCNQRARGGFSPPHPVVAGPKKFSASSCPKLIQKRGKGGSGVQ